MFERSIQDTYEDRWRQQQIDHDLAMAQRSGAGFLAGTASNLLVFAIPVLLYFSVYEYFDTSVAWQFYCLVGIEIIALVLGAMFLPAIKSLAAAAISGIALYGIGNFLFF